MRVALGLYAELGLIYQEKDSTLVLANHSEMVGNATDYATQKKLKRTNQRLICSSDCGHCPQDVHKNVHKNVHTDVRDKILEIYISRRHLKMTPPIQGRGRRYRLWIFLEKTSVS